MTCFPNILEKFSEHPANNFRIFAERILWNQNDTLNKFSFDLGQTFEDPNENLCIAKNTWATAISANPGGKKTLQKVSVISKNPSTLSWANACKLGKTCDSISSDDESEANNRSDYVKKSE